MPGNERPPRALLPRISPEESLTPELTSETSQGSQEASAPARARTLPGARSNIRSACLACRQRRSKCSGGAPCGRCRARGSDCVYEELQDRRTRAVREKGKEELDLHRKVIDGVFKAIRADGDQTVLDLVRQSASLQTIAAAIGDDSTGSDDDDMAKSIDEPQSASTPRNTIRSSVSSTTLWSVGHSDSGGPGAIVNIDSLAHSQDSAYRRNENGLQTNFAGNGPQSLAHIMGMSEPVVYPFVLKPLHNVDLSVSGDLSTYYVQFRDSSQTLIARGVLAEAIIGPRNIICNSLFRTSQYSETCELYGWVSAIVNEYPDMDGYFKLAWFVLLVRFMRWCIDSTEESYAMLPDIIKPTPLQLATPHSPFIDLVPLPKIRDSLITTLNNFTRVLQLAGASFYWQGTFEEAVHHDHISGTMTITDRFEKHVANVDHYRFGRLFLQTFPDLKNQINIADQDQIVAMPFVSEFT